MGAQPQPTDSPGPHRAARFKLPEDAVRALAQAVQHVRWLARPAGNVGEPENCRPEPAQQMIGRALATGPGWLSAVDVQALLDCYGIPSVRTEFAETEEAAAAIASHLGGSVALKATAPGLVHKSDVGGVLLDLDGPEAVKAGAQRIRHSMARAGYELDGFMVQPMAPTGVELLVGVVHDRSFGPVVACGAGGTTAELLKDVSVRITPLSDLDASELVRSLRMFPLLDGYRGAPRLDVAAVEDVLLRVSAMVERHPAIAELDLNPLIVTAAGACVSDARIRLQAPEVERPVGAL